MLGVRLQRTPPAKDGVTVGVVQWFEIWTECGEVLQWRRGTGGDRFYTYGRVRSSARPAVRACKPAPPPAKVLSVWSIVSAASSGGLFRAISQRSLQRRDQLRACRRTGLRQPESIAEGKHGVDA